MLLSITWTKLHFCNFLTCQFWKPQCESVVPTSEFCISSVYDAWSKYVSTLHVAGHQLDQSNDPVLCNSHTVHTELNPLGPLTKQAYRSQNKGVWWFYHKRLNDQDRRQKPSPPLTSLICKKWTWEIKPKVTYPVTCTTNTNRLLTPGDQVLLLHTTYLLHSKPFVVTHKTAAMK